MLIIHHDTGMIYGKRAYHDNVRRDCRASIRDERYAIGHEPPRYPVPARYNGPDNPEWHTFRAKFNARYVPKI